MKCSLSWLQELYALLHKFQIHVAREETERVDTLRYAWEKLNTLAVSTCNPHTVVSVCACSRNSVNRCKCKVVVRFHIFICIYTGGGEYMTGVKWERAAGRRKQVDHCKILLSPATLPHS